MRLRLIAGTGAIQNRWAYGVLKLALRAESDCAGSALNRDQRRQAMSLRWRRVNHWKNIRMLVAESSNVVYAYIQRGRRPNEYTIVFPKNTYSWSLRHNHCRDDELAIPDYVLTESSLEIAKAVGTFIIKTQGITE